MKKFILCSSFCLFCSLLFSTIIEIKQDGTGDYPSIQQGINAAVYFDTVLVHPGTYYENIDYLGKRITVASLELTTGDRSYINSTIINGNQDGSCVKFQSGELNAVLRGFSITNGSGEYHYNTICGGGIQVTDYSTVYIINCKIYDNHTETGAGIYIRHSNVYMQGTSIRNNYAITSGGGILIRNSSQIYFDEENRCNLYSNYAGSGIDILAAEELDDMENINVVLDTFSVSEPQYYFANYIADESLFSFDVLNGNIEPVNHDLYVSPDGDDSNSGLSSEEPMKTITHALHKIFPDSLNPKTIHLAPGSYSRSENDQIFPLSGKKYVNLIGEDMETTILDDENTSRLFNISPSNGNNVVKNITFKNCHMFTAVRVSRSNNIIFDNITITDCISESYVAFSSYKCSNLLFENVEITNNLANEDNAGAKVSGGQDYYFYNCRFANNISLGADGEWNFNNALRVNSDRDIIINNCEFIGNQDYTYHGRGVFSLGRNANPVAGTNFQVTNCLIQDNIGYNDEMLSLISCVDGNAEITNCTFVNNTGNYSTISAVGNVNMTNNIFCNNTPYEISVPNLTNEDVITTLNVSHCNIQNGINGINNEGNVNTINWLEGNIDEDPLFLNEGTNPYQLSTLSPCIDAGTPDTTGLYLPPWDLLYNQRVWDGNEDGTAIIDMGCYEFGAPVYEDSLSVEENIQYSILNSKLYNFPNPFRRSTTICFDNTQTGDVELNIFNIKGQKIKTLIDCYMSPGRSEVYWDGKDEDNKRVSDGVYFYRVNIDEKTEIVRKMVVLSR